MSSSIVIVPDAWLKVGSRLEAYCLPGHLTTNIELRPVHEVHGRWNARKFRTTVPQHAVQCTECLPTAGGYDSGFKPSGVGDEYNGIS